MRELQRDFLDSLGVRSDAKVPSEFDLLTIRVLAAVPQKVAPLFDRMSYELVEGNGRAMRVLGISPSSLRLAPVVESAKDRSIQLVEKALRLYAQDVREVFSDPENTGLRVEDLKAKLLERGNVWESRAELIARDQTLKLNSAITKTRHENAGVSEYVWSSSLDERVRPEHAALEGQRFSWSAPPEPGHPGEDYQCRCVAIPVIPELDDES